MSGVYGRKARPELWGPVRRPITATMSPWDIPRRMAGTQRRASCKRHREAEISSSQQLSTCRHEEEALLSDHLGSHWVLVAYARGENSCHFCSGVEVHVWWDGALLCSLAGLGYVGCSSWARPMPLKVLFIQPGRMPHVSSINSNWQW